MSLSDPIVGVEHAALMSSLTALPHYSYFFCPLPPPPHIYLCQRIKHTGLIGTHPEAVISVNCACASSGLWLVLYRPPQLDLEGETFHFVQDQYPPLLSYLPSESFFRIIQKWQWQCFVIELILPFHLSKYINWWMFLIVGNYSLALEFRIPFDFSSGLKEPEKSFSIHLVTMKDQQLFQNSN